MILTTKKMFNFQMWPNALGAVRWYVVFETDFIVEHDLVDQDILKLFGQENCALAEHRSGKSYNIWKIRKIASILAYTMIYKKLTRLQTYYIYTHTTYYIFYMHLFCYNCGSLRLGGARFPLELCCSAWHAGGTLPTTRDRLKGG